MATDFTIQDHHAFQFAKNVILLLQQKTSRLQGSVTSASYTGDKAQVIMQLGEVEMQNFAQADWKNDTVWSDIEHFQRWVFPGDFNLALPISNNDQLRMLTSPKSQYAEAVRAAYCRKIDDIIIAAAVGDAKTGRYDDIQTTPLPADQIITGPAGGLSIEMLIDAKEKLIAADNDPDEPRFFACSEKQLSDLLKNTKVQSMDYNTVRALVKGEVDTFVGFKFISTERLPLVGGARQCFAWVKSGLHLGHWNNLTIKTTERADKNYVWQIYAEATLGATRTDEKKLVRVDCLEA